jgi:hypothetical protein
MEMQALLELVKTQKDIIAWPIGLMLEKELKYKGSTVQYSKDDYVAIAATKILASLRASMGSALLLASQPHQEMHGKDLLPIARGIIEGCINTAYIMASGRDVAQKALEHSIYKGFRNTDKTFGSDSLKMSIKRIPGIQPSDELLKVIDQFTSKKGRSKNWTNHSVPERIAVIENSFKTSIATAFLTSYATIYGEASEVIHGSVTGADIGSGTIAFSKYPKNDNDHMEIQKSHIQSSLLTCFIAIQGVLEAFCSYANFVEFEQELKSQLSKFKVYVENNSNWS